MPRLHADEVARLLSPFLGDDDDDIDAIGARLKRERDDDDEDDAAAAVAGAIHAVNAAGALSASFVGGAIYGGVPVTDQTGFKVSNKK